MSSRSPSQYAVVKVLHKDPSGGNDVLLGVTSNTPMRHAESVLPMLGLHDRFRWMACSQDVGAEKPDRALFDASFEQAHTREGR